VTEFRSGNGATWLDFMATLIGRYRETQTEQLADPTSLRAWFAERGLMPHRAPTEDDLVQARELREALHVLARSALRDTPAPAPALRTLEAALIQDRPVAVARSNTGLRIRPPATSAEALGRIARDAAQDLSGQQRLRLRACGDSTCAGIFIDHTGRRQWCSDERCGNRARVRAHRARARHAK
jgi:predicted RNA-binding Zn ribbon-like protein